ncbi:MAG TPA: 50S ribosomal protein L11 methyltransferase [Burkholderiales bacterium]|nr:50S ribosomal protein L11 methyltransferase [Burkholderiales bacterium]
MPWLSATAIVERDAAETFSDALMDAGALSVDIADADAGTAAERPIFDEPFDTLRTGPGRALAPGWSRARVSALLPMDADVPAVLAAAFAAAGIDATTAYEVQRVDDQDWVRKTQAQFTPQEVAPGLWVVPSWHTPPQPTARNILLDPGLAFGTGTHPTTRLCLRWLARTVRPGDRVIDFGCGSGILAIAAAKLGAGSIAGVDIDPQAVQAARENARRNRVEATFVCAAQSIAAPARLVVANILARPLIVLASLLAGLNTARGHIALSGILVEQADEVRQAYAAWYDFEPGDEEDGWVLLTGRRR